MQFKEWLTNEARIMILPWPKIKKMGMDNIASDEAKKGAYLDTSKFDFANPIFEDAFLNECIKIVSKGYFCRQVSFLSFIQSFSFKPRNIK
jgi:hypothetical protein